MPTIELTDEQVPLLVSTLAQAVDAEGDAMADLLADDVDRKFYPPFLHHLTRKWHYESLLHQLERFSCQRLT